MTLDRFGFQPTCVSCTALIYVVSLALKFDISEPVVLELATIICKLFAKQPWAVCDGISSQFRVRSLIKIHGTRYFRMSSSTSSDGLQKTVRLKSAESCSPTVQIQLILLNLDGKLLYPQNLTRRESRRRRRRPRVPNPSKISTCFNWLICTWISSTNIHQKPIVMIRCAVEHQLPIRKMLRGTGDPWENVTFHTGLLRICCPISTRPTWSTWFWWLVTTLTTWIGRIRLRSICLCSGSSIGWSRTRSHRLPSSGHSGIMKVIGLRSYVTHLLAFRSSRQQFRPSHRRREILADVAV